MGRRRLRFRLTADGFQRSRQRIGGGAVAGSCLAARRRCRRRWHATPSLRANLHLHAPHHPAARPAAGRRALLSCIRPSLSVRSSGKVARAVAGALPSPLPVLTAVLLRQPRRPTVDPRPARLTVAVATAVAEAVVDAILPIAVVPVSSVVLKHKPRALLLLLLLLLSRRPQLLQPLRVQLQLLQGRCRGIHARGAATVHGCGGTLAPPLLRNGGLETARLLGHMGAAGFQRLESPPLLFSLCRGNPFFLGPVAEGVSASRLQPLAGRVISCKESGLVQGEGRGGRRCLAH